MEYVEGKKLTPADFSYMVNEKDIKLVKVLNLGDNLC
jgi:hypothetical protein